MSDTEEESSFDKEAEREKLREQLEREEEERRSTQHMSELLLKGATMTNKHCDACGDPLFRYEGQEFCPTCGQGNEGQAGGGSQQATAEGGADEAADAAGGSTGIDRVETGTSAETVQPRSPDVDEGGEAGAAASPGQQPPRSERPEQSQQPEAHAQGPTSLGAGAGSAGSAEAAGDVGAAGDATGNVENARAALSRKLASLARQAEATEDVGRSRELLAAAREAAEALAAIDDVGR